MDGLIHISNLGGGKRINHPNEVLEQGQALDVDVTVETVDLEKRRLSLALERDEKGKDESGMADDYREYLQNVPTSMGTLGDILRDKLKK